MINYFKGSEAGDLPSDTDLSESPLPPCPGSPNCLRVSRTFDRNAENLFADTLQAIESAGASKINPDPQQLQITARFRAFIFFDDLQVKIETKQSQTFLHIRSASRVGHGDLGVNRRRIKKLLSLIK